MPPVCGQLSGHVYAPRFGVRPPRRPTAGRGDATTLYTVLQPGSQHYSASGPHAVIVAFRQGVRDERMLEKLGTHEIETTAELFALADKCANAAEARAWHAPCPAADQPSSSRSNRREKKKRRRCEAVPVVSAQGPARRPTEEPDRRSTRRAVADRRPAPARSPATARALAPARAPAPTRAPLLRGPNGEVVPDPPDRVA